MTHQVPSRKPLEDDALFKTLRALHPSEAQLRDIDIVEQATLDRLKISDKVSVKLVRGRRVASRSASATLHRR